MQWEDTSNKYSGDWVDNKPEGEGEIVYGEDGKGGKYIGKFEKGKKHGHGELTGRIDVLQKAQQAEGQARLEASLAKLLATQERQPS